jgi:hypothetical protein
MSKTLMQAANLCNPHFCVGSRRDKSQMLDNSKPFANGIKA